MKRAKIPVYDITPSNVVPEKPARPRFENYLEQHYEHLHRRTVIRFSYGAIYCRSGKHT